MPFLFVWNCSFFISIQLPFHYLSWCREKSLFFFFIGSKPQTAIVLYQIMNLLISIHPTIFKSEKNNKIVEWILVNGVGAMYKKHKQFRPQSLLAINFVNCYWIHTPQYIWHTHTHINCVFHCFRCVFFSLFSKQAHLDKGVNGIRINRLMCLRSHPNCVMTSFFFVLVFVILPGTWPINNNYFYRRLTEIALANYLLVAAKCRINLLLRVCVWDWSA